MSVTRKEYGDSPGDQFESEMQASKPGAVSIAVSEPLQMVATTQGESIVVFVSPDMLRCVAHGMLDAADKWERGEVPGLKKWEAG